jgi:hypothetical protein
MMPSEWLEGAARRLHGQSKQTPLVCDGPGLNLYQKWENRLVAGSFKTRTALVQALGLKTWEQSRGSMPFAVVDLWQRGVSR